MSTMVTEVYDALIDAGASDEKAKAAATAITDYDEKLNRIDQHLTKHDGEFVLIRWMLGFNLAFTMAILWRMFA